YGLPEPRRKGGASGGGGWGAPLFQALVLFAFCGAGVGWWWSQGNASALSSSQDPKNPARLSSISDPGFSNGRIGQQVQPSTADDAGSPQENEEGSVEDQKAVVEKSSSAPLTAASLPPVKTLPAFT